MNTAAVPLKRRAAIPKISWFSEMWFESFAWAFVIGHLVKWAVDALYFIIMQVRYSVGYNGRTYQVWYAKDMWDRLPVHISNLLGLEWFGGSQTAPGWWVTDRHYARDVVIGLVAGVIITFLFIKPRHPDDVSDVGPWSYLWAVPKGIIWAIPGITIIAAMAWQLTWLTHHGLHLHSGSPLAAEINGYVTAGTWIAVAMGIAGSQVFARFANRKSADAAQWFYAERSAAAIRSNTGLGKIRGTRVIGTPSHRIRVHWLLDHDQDIQPHSAWAVRILVFALGFGVLLAGFGAWLTLAGPAAAH